MNGAGPQRSISFRKKTMKENQSVKKEDGSVLIVVLVLLVLLTGIGISASKNTEVEIQIAGNDKLHKMAFYAADGGTGAGIELLEQNIASRGFTSPNIGTTTVYTLNFYNNQESATASENIPSDTNRDASVPNIGDGTVFLKIYGDSELSTGSALQIAAGYEGKGKGLGGGGAYLVYNIRSCASGSARNRSLVSIKWRHVI